MARLFVDTNIIVRAATGADANCLNFLTRKTLQDSRITSLDITREAYRILKGMGYTEQRIKEVMEFTSDNCIIAPKADKAKFGKYSLRDRGDVFVLEGALTQKCDYLVTEDRKLLEDAKKYMKTATAKEALRIMGEK